MESPSKVIAKKKADLNKPFKSVVDKKQLRETRMQMLFNSNNLPKNSTDTPATSASQINGNSSIVTKFQTPENGQLTLQKNYSSSVSSNIAEFIPDALHYEDSRVVQCLAQQSARQSSRG